MDAPADPALLRFRAALDELYGPRLKRVILFGSRARGDAQADSDYDVAVFLEPINRLWVESDGLSRIELQTFDDTGAQFHVIPLPKSAWDDRTAFMGELRRDGIEI
jgi:predicted nucleotidyltransferase